MYNATSNSLTVKWDPASGRVQKYRITHRPSTGEGNEQTVIHSVKVYVGNILPAALQLFPLSIYDSNLVRECRISCSG